MGQVEFKDFLWEALLDRRPRRSPWATRRKISRGNIRSRAPRWTRYAARSFERAVKAKEVGFLAGEIAPVRTEEFKREGYNVARHQAVEQGGCSSITTRIFVRRRSSRWRKSARRSAACRPAAIRRPSWMARRPRSRLGRLRQKARQDAARRGSWRAAAAGVPPEIMGIGPVPAIQAVRGDGRAQALGHRPLRDQRGVRRAGDGAVRARSTSTRTS